MGVIGEPRNFYKKFKFIIEVDGFASAAFQDCSELSAEVAKIEQWEGGSLVPDKDPGRVTFADITLQRGATEDLDMWDWFEEVADVAANAGLINPEFKRNLDIVQQERDGSTLRRWRVELAWPTKFVAGDWDNNADENVIESVTLTFRKFKPI